MRGSAPRVSVPTLLVYECTDPIEVAGILVPEGAFLVVRPTHPDRPAVLEIQITVAQAQAAVRDADDSLVLLNPPSPDGDLSSARPRQHPFRRVLPSTKRRTIAQGHTVAHASRCLTLLR